MMRKFLLQAALILLITLSCAVIYNYLLSEPLPLFKTYNPLDSDKALIMGEQPFIDEIDVEMLKALKEQGQIILVDARIEPEYRTSHISGAISLPISEFKRLYPIRSKQFPVEKIIVTYCSEKHCLDSLLLARKLVKYGHDSVFVYLGGIEEWVKMNLPVETGINHVNHDEE
jgi:rhodanese-related sulfurtransferase